jgi:hypothetical protein
MCGREKAALVELGKIFISSDVQYDCTRRERLQEF